MGIQFTTFLPEELADGIMIAARLFLSLTFASTAVASTVAAQGSGNGFLFQRPRGSIAIRAGYARASARSDLFSFTANQLTLDRGDFSGPTVGADLALRLGSRTDVVFATSYAGTSKPSEFRSFVDEDDNAIQQTTTFQRVPLTVNVRAYLTPRGRAVGDFAWMPARLAPYAGIGAGGMWYRFRQTGDFVDFEDNDVFTATLASSGWTPAAQAMAGVEYSVGPRLALAAQATYLWAKGRPSADFSGFDRIDLSGLSTTVGLSVRF